jgi:hypothetical protein
VSDADSIPAAQSTCLIASTTVLPELVRMRGQVDDMTREQRSHDDRITRLHLQADDSSRRLTRLEGMVETQTRETHALTIRLDSLDTKVGALVDGVNYVRGGIDSLAKAFTDHGITSTEQHHKRMRGQMSLWVLLGGSLAVLSALHYQATGITPLQAIAGWVAGLVP